MPRATQDAADLLDDACAILSTSRSETGSNLHDLAAWQDRLDQAGLSLSLSAGLDDWEGTSPGVRYMEVLSLWKSSRRNWSNACRSQATRRAAFSLLSPPVDLPYDAAIPALTSLRGYASERIGTVLLEAFAAPNWRTTRDDWHQLLYAPAWVVPAAQARELLPVETSQTISPVDLPTAEVVSALWCPEDTTSVYCTLENALAAARRLLDK